MLWLKAFHVIAVVTWFAGLFYLPRLYVYHAQASDAIGTQRFELMERRLFAIMTIGAAAGIFFGGLMLIESPGYLQMTWLKVKLLFVALVIGYHAYCYKLMRDFAARRNTRSANWFRAFNEVPSLLLIVIVILAVVKPG
jgi:putative membrane protein